MPSVILRFVILIHINDIKDKLHVFFCTDLIWYFVKERCIKCQFSDLMNTITIL